MLSVYILVHFYYFSSYMNFEEPKKWDVRHLKIEQTKSSNFSFSNLLSQKFYGLNSEWNYSS